MNTSLSQPRRYSSSALLLMTLVLWQAPAQTNESGTSSTATAPDMQQPLPGGNLSWHGNDSAGWLLWNGPTDSALARPTTAAATGYFTAAGIIAMVMTAIVVAVTGHSDRQHRRRVTARQHDLLTELEARASQAQLTEHQRPIEHRQPPPIKDSSPPTDY